MDAINSVPRWKKYMKSKNHDQSKILQNKEKFAKLEKLYFDNPIITVEEKLRINGSNLVVPLIIVEHAKYRRKIELELELELALNESNKKKLNEELKEFGNLLKNNVK